MSNGHHRGGPLRGCGGGGLGEGAATAFHVGVQALILREADGCRKPGELGSLLRREGLT